MVHPSLAKAARAASRGLPTARIARVSSRSSPATTTSSLLPRASPFVPARAAVVSTPRFISTSSSRTGITPDNAPPKPKDAHTPEVLKTPVALTDHEYHAVADEYLNRLVSHLEDLQDKREDVDVEYSAGVLTVRFGPDVGVYVINKQPPNKQIWLSSPKSGPKRYDYVILGEGQHEKQDTATGEWMYLRDSSTINDLLIEELGIDIGEQIE
ncbi:Frataxin-like domain-containing protein [Podospora appendiculata]|uniref:ferroxidase n=1 Tax=Podospora appendiculata TaxID=314037 RepID=A0AAE1C8T8_9PEZI|nr:Frataxin-like domain-containing protein [Podospora appendiculata]